MDKKVIICRREKVTTNCVRFKEVSQPGVPPIVGTVYLPQWFCGNESEVQVTVETPADIAGTLPKKGGRAVPPTAG